MRPNRSWNERVKKVAFEDRDDCEEYGEEIHLQVFSVTSGQGVVVEE